MVTNFFCLAPLFDIEPTKNASLRTVDELVSPSLIVGALLGGASMLSLRLDSAFNFGNVWRVREVKVNLVVVTSQVLDADRDGNSEK